MCRFSPVLRDAELGTANATPGSPVVGLRLLYFGDTEITASAAITVDSTSIVYVGYMDRYMEG